MRTSKPFATISYNTKDFLIKRLNELIQARKIDFYAFIEHLPEEDETKSHKHLFVVPSRQYDTFTFCDELKEIDKNNLSGKPLGCIACRSSKFGDWYLYGLHDIGYLATKGQTRKYYYTKAEFIVSEEDYFNEQIHLIDFSKLNRVETLITAVRRGESFDTLIKRGQVPVQLINQYEKMFYILASGTGTERNGKDGHESVDRETGEILTGKRQC